MSTKDFIDKHCRYCINWEGLNPIGGCRAYDGEECDEAFNHPLYKGKKMVQRINELCEKIKARKAK